MKRAKPNNAITVWRARRQRALDAARARRTNLLNAAASRKRRAPSNNALLQAKRQRAAAASRKRRAQSNNARTSTSAKKSLMDERARLYARLYNAATPPSQQAQLYRRIRNIEYALLR